MRIEHLSLKGILRFSDRIDLDLRELPPGLIAVVGPNGSGKTSLLETVPATLYRSFPSRSDRELFDYAHDRDSFLEVTLAMDGRGLYRARVNLDAVRRTSEAVLVHAGPDGTETVMNDGRVTSFDQIVAATFPSQSLLLASAFAAQNRAGSFATLDRKGRKDLFAKLLGLDHYEAMAQTARTAAGLVEAARGRLAAVRDALTRDTHADQDVALTDADAGFDTEHGRALEVRGRLETSIMDVDARLATVQDQVAARAVATQRVRSLEGELGSRREGHARVQTSQAAHVKARIDEEARIRKTHERAVADLHARRQSTDVMLARDLARIDAALTTMLADIDERIANRRTILSDADAIRAAALRVVEIDRALAIARADEQRWRDEGRALDGRIRDNAEARTKATHAAADLRRVSTDAHLVDDVPCQASGEYASCQFLRQALAAKDQIPALRAVADTLPALVVTGAALADAVQVGNAQLRTIHATIAELEADRAKAANQAKLAPEISATEARIQELTDKRADAIVTADRDRIEAAARATAHGQEIAVAGLAADTDLAVALQDAARRADAQASDLAEQLQATAAAIADATTRLEAARFDLTATEAGAQEATALSAELAVLRRQWDETTAALARIAAGREEIARRRAALEQRRAELADVDARLRALEADLVEWQLLSKALGREGLPVLEIDAAGPAVSSLTNDLLASAYGPRFTIDVVTQEAKASGKGTKEAFDVKVWDGERGGDARDLTDLSGGEQVIVSEALANALALYVNIRGATKIESLFRDETTGALDAENADRYIGMLRRMQSIGGLHHIFFVSHSAAAASQADAQIRCADGTAAIVLPPYREVA